MSAGTVGGHGGAGVPRGPLHGRGRRRGLAVDHESLPAPGQGPLAHFLPAGRTPCRGLGLATTHKRTPAPTHSPTPMASPRVGADTHTDAQTRPGTPVRSLRSQGAHTRAHAHRIAHVNRTECERDRERARPHVRPTDIRRPHPTGHAQRSPRRRAIRESMGHAQRRDPPVESIPLPVPNAQCPVRSAKCLTGRLPSRHDMWRLFHVEPLCSTARTQVLTALMLPRNARPLAHREPPREHPRSDDPPGGVHRTTWGHDVPETTSTRTWDDTSAPTRAPHAVLKPRSHSGCQVSVHTARAWELSGSMARGAPGSVLSTTSVARVHGMQRPKYRRWAPS